MTAGASSALVGRLRALDTCSVSDALDRLANPTLGAVVSGVPQASGEGRIAGIVTTMKLGVGVPPPGPPRHLGTTAIEASGPDHVIVIEQRSGVEAGSWGGLLTLGAKARGVAGVIADGPVRDIDEAIGHGFSIFTRQFTARTARGRIVELACNEPIVAFDVAVNPDDYVLADRSAVVFIRAEAIESVLDAAEAIVSREAAMAKAIAAGTPISQVMSGAYEHMLTGPQ
jgi:regulator of RNase E activity RraA